MHVPKVWRFLSFSKFAKVEKNRQHSLEESKVVRDSQDDNVLLDHLHCLHGYLTFFGYIILI